MHMGPAPDGQGGLPTKSNGQKQGGHRASYHRGNWRPSTGEPRYRCWTCSRSSHIPVGNVAWRREPTYASKNRTKPHAHIAGQWEPVHASKHHVEPQAARCRQDRFVPTYIRFHAGAGTHEEHGDPTIDMDTYAHGTRARLGVNHTLRVHFSMSQRRFLTKFRRPVGV